MRLRRSELTGPGLRRRRRGRGFSYYGPDREPITDPEVLDRIRALVIPPAWQEVWICPDPRGHIQAVGLDAAGRRQYRYHDAWRVKRDAAKFDHVLEVAAALPRLRRAVDAGLAGRGLTRDRVFGAVATLLDHGGFRIGGEEYADADEAAYGLATLRRDQVRTRGDTMVFDYAGKGGQQVSQQVDDARIASIVRALLRRRDPSPELFGYWTGQRWADVRSAEINDYLREQAGIDITAKDFRTWHATVRAAVELAQAGPVSSAAGRRRAAAAAIREVAELLGNTPTVARNSYVDPRVIDRYHDGVTIALPRSVGGRPAAEHAWWHRAERSVLRLLTG